MLVFVFYKTSAKAYPYFFNFIWLLMVNATLDTLDFIMVAHLYWWRMLKYLESRKSSIPVVWYSQLRFESNIVCFEQRLNLQHIFCHNIFHLNYFFTKMLLFWISVANIPNTVFINLILSHNVKC